MKVLERDATYTPAHAASDTQLYPFGIFSGEQGQALVILNTLLAAIDLDTLWHSAPVRICADGGANRLHERASDPKRYIPEYITGDLDSIEPHVRDFYIAHGTRVIPQHSQYSSDLMKALKIALIVSLGLQIGTVDEDDGLSDVFRSTNIQPATVYIAGGLDGRFDQLFQLINQLYAMRETCPQAQMYYVTASDVVFLAPRGRTFVGYKNKAFCKEAVPSCGLLPFKNSTVLNTDGLRYDVQDWPLQVGGQVSSSNGVVGTSGFYIDSTEDIIVNVEVSWLR